MKRFIIFLFLYITCINCYCNDVLVKSCGTGKNKQEATLSALRFALADAYGTYISSRSSINTEDLFTDETVMITNGYIKSYKEIEYNESTKIIKLNVIVSVDKLNKYVNNHGSSVSINGSSLIANNEVTGSNNESVHISFNHILEKLTDISTKCYNYKLDVDEPVIYGNKVILNISIKCTDNIIQQNTFQNVYDKALSDAYKHYDMSNEYVKFQINKFNEAVNTITRLGYFSFILRDNLGNKINCLYSDKALREHARLIRCERYNDGAGIFCQSSRNIEISRGNCVLYGNVIKLTLKYNVSDFRNLKNIEVFPE